MNTNDDDNENTIIFKKWLLEGYNPFEELLNETSSATDDTYGNNTSTTSNNLEVASGGKASQPEVKERRGSGSSYRLARDLASKPLTETLCMTTTSSLNIARYIGKFIAIMRDLSPLCLSAFEGLQELFDLYLYAVFSNFGIAPYRFWSESFNLYPTLRMAVRGIRTRLEGRKFGGGVAASGSEDASGVVGNHGHGGHGAGPKPAKPVNQPPPPPPRASLSLKNSQKKRFLNGLAAISSAAPSGVLPGSSSRAQREKQENQIPLVARLDSKVEQILTSRTNRLVVFCSSLSSVSSFIFLLLMHVYLLKNFTKINKNNNLHVSCLILDI